MLFSALLWEKHQSILSALLLGMRKRFAVAVAVYLSPDDGPACVGQNSSRIQNSLEFSFDAQFSRFRQRFLCQCESVPMRHARISGGLSCTAQMSTSLSSIARVRAPLLVLFTPAHPAKTIFPGFEYLPFERVHHLTYPGQYTVVTEQIYDGILQKFVAPREAHDSIIRCACVPSKLVSQVMESESFAVSASESSCTRVAYMGMRMYKCASK